MRDEVWREAPAAALRVVRGPAGIAVEANPRAREWAADQGLGEADWQPLAEAACDRPPGAYRARLGAVSLQCRQVALPEGCLIWLSPDLGPPQKATAATAAM
jgi:hypothetical protein